MVAVTLKCIFIWPIYFLFQESVAGAKQFVSGVGRHGKFYNLTDRKQTQPVRSKV
jgi:hypothetical protein